MLGMGEPHECEAEEILAEGAPDIDHSDAPPFPEVCSLSSLALCSHCGLVFNAGREEEHKHLCQELFKLVGPTEGPTAGDVARAQDIAKAQALQGTPGRASKVLPSRKRVLRLYFERFIVALLLRSDTPFELVRSCAAMAVADVDGSPGIEGDDSMQALTAKLIIDRIEGKL